MAPRLHHPESLNDVKEKSGLLIEKNLYSFRLPYLRGLPVHAIYARVTAFEKNVFLSPLTPTLSPQG